MNEITTRTAQLPDTLEDLSRFVLVNEERVQALRAEIRAIKKVSLAKEVYEQKLAEAQEIGKVTVEAAQKMGELLLQIEQRRGAVNSSRDSEELKTKTEITSDMGMTANQVSEYQRMAQNPEAVQAAIDKAIERGDVVSRSQVMKEIKVLKDEIARRDAKIDEMINSPTVEVVPPKDYDTVKSQLRAVTADLENEKAKRNQDLRRNMELKEEIDRLRGATKEGLDTENLSENVYYFCTLANNFIGNVGGLVWLTDRIADMPQKEKDLFLKAAYSFRDWASAFTANLERRM
jgi:hypothetical protein